jgi:phosphate-selective porin OprO/OprP
MTKATFALLLAAAPALYAGSGSSSEKAVIETREEKSILDKIWDAPTFYKNDHADFLNELRFVGRFHGDIYSLDSNLGSDSDEVVRRLRLGLKARFFHHLDLHVETELDPQNDDPAYKRLTDAYLAWTFSDALKLTVGKHSAKFTLDGATSSNELLTPERNNLANNVWFTNEYIPGASLSGKIGHWVYNTGIYSGGHETKEFGNFDAGKFGIFSVGYDFGPALGAKKALLRADYVYNERNLASTSVRPFENIGSVVFQLDEGKWGLSTDVSYATGYGAQSNVYGFVVMPWLNLTKKLQLVARYTYLESEEINGLRLNRYDNVMTTGKGDRYSEIYAGLNYFVYGHKLKLQSGVAWSDMSDDANDGGHYHAWLWTTALRVSW